MSVIEAEELLKRFRNFTAVDTVSFTVGRGEIFGFLGPNGAGKTTTINMLTTLLTPTSGIARVAGFDVVKERQNVRKSIGLVFQEVTLDEVLTAWENLEFHGILYGMDRKTRRARIDEFLRMVGLFEDRNRVVKTFSGGMKRRLEIARALLHSPQVLFLDEPTIGLDVQTRIHLWGYLRELRQREHITIFLTTHYMDEAEYADRIAIIDHGQIIASGAPARLKAILGGDIVRLSTEDDGRAAEILKTQYGVEVRREEGELLFEIGNAGEFLPRLLKDFPISVRKVSLASPTLEDVFVHLTGRAIRASGPDKHSALESRVRRGRKP